MKAFPSTILLTVVLLTGCRTPDPSPAASDFGTTSHHPAVRADHSGENYQVSLGDVPGASFHGGRTSPEGEGMGKFTIYDWGNSAVTEAANRILNRYGHVYLDRRHNHAL